MIYVVKLCAKDIQVTASNETEAYAFAKEDASQFAGRWNYLPLGATLDPSADAAAELPEFDMQCTVPGKGNCAIWTFDGYLNVVVDADTEALALAYAPQVPKTGKTSAVKATGYMDARGVDMHLMSFAEAIEIVHQMAQRNQIDDHDAAGDENLIAQRAWQQTAIDTLGDFGTNYCDALEGLPTPAAHASWPDMVWRADRAMAADDVSNAIRICLDMAQQGQLDPRDVEGVEQAEMFDRQTQAFELTTALLGIHGSNLEKAISIDTGPLIDGPKI